MLFIMATSVYNINKGINKPIEFKGLKAQYIGYLAGGLVALLVLFSVLYIIGVNMYICLGLIVILGTVLFMFVYRISHKYGQYGLMKKAARRSIPSQLLCASRRLFVQLSKCE
jgi:predicted lysophospholipase L1 biosynthesis ABC-type transport system permease subunit